MDGMTRRALKVAIDTVRRELKEAGDLRDDAARDLGRLQNEHFLEGASSDDPEMAKRIDGIRLARERDLANARKRYEAAGDRIGEANISLSWLIEQALYAK